MGDSSELGVPLAATLRHLRAELRQAMEEGADEALRFKIEGLEVELAMTVGRDVEGGGGIKFWVVDASGKYKSQESNTHTLKVKLSPVSRTGGEVLIDDRTPDKPTTR